MHSFLEYASIAAAAIAGALAARGRGIDLFGVLVLSMVCAFGGGTLRDICLATPVFWISNYSHVLTALIAAVVTFVIARTRDVPNSLLEYFDAIGLAIYAVFGAQKALQFGATPLAAVALGTMTGVAGGVLRDILLNEVPIVFRRETRLYATAAIVGCTVFLLLHSLSLPMASLVGSAFILLLRIAAIRFSLSLPEFEDRRRHLRPPNPKNEG
jgi:uncharacterized membrane protein YeiH